MNDTVKTINLAAFRWNPKKGILHHKRALPWGNFPSEVKVQGKYNKVLFRHSRNDLNKQHAYYDFVSVDGPDNPHINQSVKLLIPWR